MTLRMSQPRARRRWGVLVVSVVMLITALGGAALAVHDDGLFELDRNTINDAGAGEDWNDIFAGTDTASASSLQTDATGTTIFTTGGSKDDLDTTQWRHTAGSVPDKDELLTGYVARYEDIVYFGADRFAGNGSAQMGFWFFQQEVAPIAGGLFSGAHTDGDILVLSEFTNGGAATNIRVFQWHSPGGAINGTLDLIAGNAAIPADCVASNPPLSNDNFCATVNAATINVPWPYDAKGGGNQPGVVPSGQFYEGGIDLAFLNLEEECFASFLVETRSSPSTDATLKDFVGGSFQPCETTTTTTPSDSNGDPLESIILGDEIHDYAVVAGTGSSAAPTGDVSFSICAPDELDDPVSLTDNPATCDIGGTFVSTNALTQIGTTASSDTLSDAFTPDAIGTWCWRGEYSGDDNYPASSDSSTGECFEVTDIASTTTAQKWLPNDTATVTAQGGSTVSGTVTFDLYESADCTGTAVQSFPDRPVVAGVAESNNVTYYTSALTISWKATFSSDNDVDSGDPSHCETMTVSVLDNDITVP